MRIDHRSTWVRGLAGTVTCVLLAAATWGCSSAPAGTTAPSAVATAATTNAASASPLPSVAPGASATSQPSVSASPRPASGTLTFAGDPGLAGDLTISGIRCQLPAVAGLTIAIFGTTPNSLLAQVILASGSIAIRLYTQAFQQWDTGKSCALAYIVLIMVLAITNLYVKYLNRVKER